jgi:hypothetical protein
MFGHIRVVICAYHAISDECMANACYISAVYGDLNFNGITMQEKVFLYAHIANEAYEAPFSLRGNKNFLKETIEALCQSLSRENNKNYNLRITTI